jgi:hypothetical protein
LIQPGEFRKIWPFRMDPIAQGGFQLFSVSKKRVLEVNAVIVIQLTDPLTATIFF